MGALGFLILAGIAMGQEEDPPEPLPPPGTIWRDYGQVRVILSVSNPAIQEPGLGKVSGTNVRFGLLAAVTQRPMPYTIEDPATAPTGGQVVHFWCTIGNGLISTAPVLPSDEVSVGVRLDSTHFAPRSAITIYLAAEFRLDTPSGPQLRTEYVQAQVEAYNVAALFGFAEFEAVKVRQGALTAKEWMAALHHDDFCFTYPTWNVNTVLQHVGVVTLFYENSHGGPGLFEDNARTEIGDEDLAPPRQAGVSAGIPPMHFAFMDSCKSVWEHRPPLMFSRFGEALLYPHDPASELERRALLGWAIEADIDKTAAFGNAIWGELLEMSTVEDAREFACLTVYPNHTPSAIMFVVGDPYTRLKGVYTGDGVLPAGHDWYQLLWQN